MSVAQWVRRIRGTADLRVNHSANTTEVALDDSGFLKYGQGGTTRTVVDAGQSQTITGDKTLSGTTTLSGATTLSGTTTLSGAVAFTGTTTKSVIQQMQHAKVGTTAGWVVNAADNKNSLGRQAAGTTNATLVVPLEGLRVGDIITGYYLVGQIESGGNACTVDAALRKQTAAAADLTDAAVTNGAITQVAASADTIISATNAVVTGLTTTVAADETYYVLITSTTAASTDVDLQSVNVTKTAV